MASTILVRLVAVIAGLSVAMTVWFLIALVGLGGLPRLMQSGALGWLTMIGWVITFGAGPVAAVQLWRLRESGRRAGIVLFGSGFAYYLVGLGLRSPEAHVPSIVEAIVGYGLLLTVLSTPWVRARCRRA